MWGGLQADRYRRRIVRIYVRHSTKPIKNSVEPERMRVFSGVCRRRTWWNTKCCLSNNPRWQPSENIPSGVPTSESIKNALQGFDSPLSEYLDEWLRVILALKSLNGLTVQSRFFMIRPPDKCYRTFKTRLRYNMNSILLLPKTTPMHGYKFTTLPYEVHACIANGAIRRQLTQSSMNSQSIRTGHNLHPTIFCV